MKRKENCNWQKYWPIAFFPKAPVIADEIKEVAEKSKGMSLFWVDCIARLGHEPRFSSSQ